MIHPPPAAALIAASQPYGWENFQLPNFPSVTGLPAPVTAGSLAHFLYALLWIFVLLISFTGWGRGTTRLLRSGRLPVSTACSLGIAVVIFLGGVLNLLQALYIPVLFALVATGLALYIWLQHDRPAAYRWKPFWVQMSPAARTLLIVALAILALRVAATVRLGGFNVDDDGAAYLIFPQKMLALHHFAPDPFSDRRVISGLGGAYLLQAFAIAPTSLPHIAMADRSLGLLLLAPAILDIAIFFGLSPLQFAWMELLAYLVPQATMNLTFVMLPVPLLLGMVWLLLKAAEGDDGKPARNALLAGLVGGAIIALKSTYVPIVGMFALVPFLIIAWRTRTARALRLPIVAGLACLVVLLCWMFAMKMTSGTYLFPIFGPGVDYSAHFSVGSIEKFPNLRTVAKVFLQGFVLLVLAGILLTGSEKRKRAWSAAAILIAAALAIIAFNYRTGGDFIWRYNFPQFFCAILIFYAGTASNFLEQPHRFTARAAFSIGALSLLGMMFYYDAAGQSPRPFRQMLSEWGDYRPALRASLTGISLARPTLVEEYRAVEKALPDRGTALEDVGRPYLFNYRDHSIYVMDWPGAAGPTPGWPFGVNSNRLAEYLLRNSVRYVISFRNVPWNEPGTCGTLAHRERFPKELYVLFWMRILANHQLGLLRTQYQSIYDDGKIVVVDLTRPIPDAPAESPAWNFHTDINEMCTEVIDRYQKDSLSAHPY